MLTYVYFKLFFLPNKKAKINLIKEFMVRDGGRRLERQARYGVSPIKAGKEGKCLSKVLPPPPPLYSKLQT